MAATDTYGLYSTGMDTAVNSYGCNIKRTGASGSYSYSVASDWANRPVNFVSYWDSCRFANWLGNGQPTGAQNASTTERGAYTVDGYTGQDGRTIQRNVGATWAVTREDEWYKAAYYKGGSTSAGYWDYPTSSDSINTGVANWNWSVGHTTDVGSYANTSAYGTFDQGGNVWEFNEAIVAYDSGRGMRGGSFGPADYGGDSLRASSRYYYVPPANEFNHLGFRVSAVPEPGSIIALLGGLVGLLGMRRRRA